MVDSNDRRRIDEVKGELMHMLLEEELRDAVLLVFANKQVSLLYIPLYIICNTTSLYTHVFERMRYKGCFVYRNILCYSYI